MNKREKQAERRGNRANFIHSSMTPAQSIWSISDNFQVPVIAIRPLKPVETSADAEQFFIFLS